MRSDTLTGIACAVSIVLLGLGCATQRTTLDRSAVGLYPGEDYELDFWDELTTQPVVTNDDALHGLLLVVAPELVEANYVARLDAARKRGWIGEDTDLPPTESARVGMIAVAVCDILEIQGGVTMRLLGPSPRYCTRELVFRRVIPLRTATQSLTGLEFIDLVGRVEDSMDPG